MQPFVWSPLCFPHRKASLKTDVETSVLALGRCAADMTTNGGMLLWVIVEVKERSDIDKSNRFPDTFLSSVLARLIYFEKKKNRIYIPNYLG